MIYIAYKYTNSPDKDKLRKNLETLAKIFEKENKKTFILYRDKKKWGKAHSSNRLHSAFYMICNLVFAEHVLLFVDNKVDSPGLNFEIRYAKLLGKPITLLIDSSIPADNIRSKADHILEFQNNHQLEELNVTFSPKFQLALKKI